MAKRYVLALISLLLMALSAIGQTPTPAPAPKSAPQAEAAPDPKYKVGDAAPDFTMKDQNRQDVTLSSFRGKKNVVLAFYIFAFTGG